MYQLHLALPDVVVSDPDRAEGALARLPVLERLLRVADVRPADADWRRWVMGLAGASAPPGDLPVGRTLAAHAGLTPTPGDGWLVATPVRLVAGLSSVHFDPAGPVDLAPDAAQSLAARQQAEWADPALRLVAAGATLLVQLAAPVRAATQDPASLAGLGLDAGRPQGPDAARLERLMTELQMWLHERGPAGRDGRAANGLWLWGGGAGAVGTGGPWPVLGAADPFLNALARAAPSDPARRVDIACVADLVARGGSFADADREWFQPLEARLRDGEISLAELHCHGRVHVLRRGQRWRAWRRRRPWWERLG